MGDFDEEKIKEMLSERFGDNIKKSFSTNNNKFISTPFVALTVHILCTHNNLSSQQDSRYLNEDFPFQF